MKISYPSFTEQFRSPLPPGDLLRIVQGDTTLPYTWKNQEADFWGKVYADSFEIRRIPLADKVFPPVIAGQVKALPNGYGSTLEPRYRERTGKLWASAFSGLLIAFFTSAIAIPTFQAGQASGLALLIPPVALALFATLVVASFRFQVWLSRRTLVKLLALERVVAPLP